MIKSITHFSKEGGNLGIIEGRCMVCGKEVNNGLAPSISDSFTGFSYLGEGSCFCSFCASFFKEPKNRKSCWIGTKEEGTIYLKKKDIIEYILNPPNPPFAIYVTRSFKKQGWLSGMHLVNYNRDKFFILTDFVDKVFVDREEAKQKYRLISFLREKKIIKRELLDGEFRVTSYKRALEEGWGSILEEIRFFKKNPLWEVLVYVAE